ncbi:aldehyde dehydrogenase family protein [Rhizobium hidalgonense]|uniref:aldehyde dehydrogenase (NAD(+)) n=1 Tax=Rhizobium hidalgonense TaxID=1538159 RepID=A0ABX4JNC2_9HYPH|nr:aldehyde dehydrogenase family protein [Rhizobium hidalgonense]MDR9813979.1 aldehyde dehydrogenase family protein [Rhizobium hidalgonense]PDT21395.1 aldehyde dehydrogenase [Rhizobium hidalgonense]PON08053.1 aldehyde dehydrogenase [Rhizobium hidalgonense]
MTTFSLPLNLYIPSALLDRRESVLIDGRWHAGHGAASILSVDPSTSETFASFIPASVEQVAEASEAAARAFDDWRRTSGRERSGFLRAIAKGLKERKSHLVALQVLNNGKPRYEAEIDVDDASATFEYYAGLAEHLDAQQGQPVELAEGALTGATHFEPIGPVGLIVAWNFPMVTTAWKLAPALAAGCTAVLKPSEFTTLAELVYGDLAAQVGLPAGVLNIVPGGGDVGAALCADKRIRKISFTGSNATGGRVMTAAAQRVVPVSLELGGKSPIIVLGDADISQAVEIAAAGIFFNCGQMCSATSRLLVADTIADDFTEALVAKANQLLVAGHDNPNAEMGPLTTAEQYRKVKAVLERARVDGLDCVAGGNPARDRQGFFVEPSIYRNVPTDHPMWREEIFGPVLAIRSFSSTDEAVALANDTDFGLAASVVGTDGEAAAAVARRLDAGHVWVNTSQMIFPNTAWGGFKASGIGRELGPWGLAAYRGIKHITRAA